MDRMELYKKGLNTWAKWADSNLNSTNTRIFFQGVSPDHEGCKGKTGPAQSPGNIHPGEIELEKVFENYVKIIRPFDQHNKIITIQIRRPSIHL
uniref:Putative ovule protein n=1 Tax=Solanum chacoense TaxID=4108 RepID=A0A0V0GQZ4_SOLCH